MAKFIPGAGVAEIRGKLGGVIFSRNQYGPYTRPYASPVQPLTTPQLLNRERFQEASAAWPLLTETQKAAWRACSTIIIDNLGRPIKLSGYALYIYVNKNLVFLQQPQLDLPPADFSVPQLYTNITADCSAALAGPPARKEIKISFLPTPAGAGTVLIIWATAKTTLGRNVMKGKERVIFYSAAAPVSPLTVTTAYETYFGQMATADIDTCKIFFKIVIMKLSNGMMTRGVAGGCIYGQTKVILD